MVQVVRISFIENEIRLLMRAVSIAEQQIIENDAVIPGLQKITQASVNRMKGKLRDAEDYFTAQRQFFELEKKLSDEGLPR